LIGEVAWLPACLGQDAAYKVEAVDEALPPELAEAIKGELDTKSFRVTAEDGKPLAQFWLRKQVAAKAKPVGPDGAVQFPFLAEGELLGAVRYAAEGHDYRDQTILPGVYTIRFGLHPINGDHLGVSPYRDYGMLLPAERDGKVAPPDRKALETASAEAAGTNHPAVLLIRIVKGEAKAGSLTRDAEKNFSGFVFPLALRIGGGAEPVNYPIDVVFSGAAAQ
jgi:hypothetical protein